MQQAGQNEESVEISETTDRSLNANDRCDACGAQAYIRVGLSTGELLFCSHHGNANKAKLEPIAKFWHDESDKLLVR
jgi:ssDNA-binding Zn-finger/Zn-ribbon topoisomerase 1